MSYYNLCGIGSQHSNISKGKKGGGIYKNHWYARLFTKFGQGNVRGVAKQCFD